MTSRFLGEHSGPWLSGSDRSSAVLVQPIGAFEHHGPHLPLQTDAIVVDELARALVESCSALELMVLPTLSYGLSSEHVWAPGTVSLGPTTLIAVLDDLASSAARAGIRRLVLLNGHGGNTHLLRVACREIRIRHGLLTFLLHPALPPDNGGEVGDPRERGFGIHGGLAETSVMLHLRPDLVDMGKAEASVPDWLDGFEHVGFGRAAEFGWSSQDLCASGVVGDPTCASADLGREHVAHALTSLGSALAEIAVFDFPGRKALDGGVAEQAASSSGAAGWRTS